jgi:aminopeptidase N
MRNDQVVTVYRADYRVPAFLVDRVELEFDLDPARTVVTATLDMVRNPRAADGAAPLVLDGEDLELIALQIDGRPAPETSYAVNAAGLTVHGLPDRARLRIRNAIAPARNTELMGLYVSNGTFFTQCEAEGFRRITYFPDRPDVMARYSVTLRADRKQFPVLLSNGNLDAAGEAGDRPGWHWARWVDPFPKPSYLFALVAGPLVNTDARFRTRSGREVLLQVWVAPGDEDKAAHAMDCLVHAIRWDETRFGLELDLDRFMIVASHDFNIGAMENKGLNIFNAKYVLANPRVATDEDYAHVEAIVAHEYFHNWTGNRVTCRDWFQLSLKEGLTVFRDQEFSADRLRESAAHGDPAKAAGEADSGEARWAAAVKRIEDVRRLRAMQFPEDAGPQAHPVRPDSYQEISNFYTPTVYEKGAEVVRMYQTQLGRDGFRRGLELYFKRHDGQAVTCDEFLTAMRDANPQARSALADFERWYAQAGTPRVTVSTAYDDRARTFDLTLVQHTAATPGQSDKLPVPIPFAVGLVLPDGSDALLRLDTDDASAAKPGGTRVLALTQTEQRFRFLDIKAPPVPSLARGFSAPVAVDYRYSDTDLAFLAEHDSDPFNRWEAVQRLAHMHLAAATDAIETGSPPPRDDMLVTVFGHLLGDSKLSPAFRHLALQLPAEGFVAEARAMVDPQAIRAARLAVARDLGHKLAPQWQRTYDGEAIAGPYRWDPAAAGRRALRNLALAYLVDGGEAATLELARAQLERADNITDREAALTAIVNCAAPAKAQVLLDLARAWAHEPLLMNKWFRVQATAVAQAGEPPVLARVQMLTRHPAYSPSNPNNVYALVLAFCAHNLAEFHREDGSGYRFWAEQVIDLDRRNPTVAARVARTLDRWRKYTPNRKRLMHAALEEVAAAKTLSRDVREIVTKALAG